MVAVDFVIKKSWDEDDIKPEDMAVLRAWAEEAAVACSEANYQKELDTLEALKADGYRIVPFNRRALVEQSWLTTLESSHGYWTIEQFDRLVRLGNFPSSSIIPSSLVSKMPAQKRQEALKHDAEAIFRLNEAKERIENREKARLQSSLPPEQLPPPAPASDGEKAFNRCRSCHQVGETARNAMGPHLNGLLGRKIASAPGFNYSNAIKDSRIVWTEAELTNFLKNPKALMPNPAHTEFSDERQIQNLVRYLKQFKVDGKKN
jgi:cytochrome c